MRVTSKDVKRVGVLSALAISEANMDQFIAEFDQTLEYAELLEKVDVTGVQPSPYVLPIKNVFREDIAVPGCEYEDVFKNAAEVHNNGFKVPRVLD